MSDHTLYDTTAPSAGSVALAHQKILRLKQNGVFINITGDINNLAMNPTKVTVPRENYGIKAVTSEDIVGYTFAPTFSVEGVRDPVTKMLVASQDWVIDLLNAAASTGEDNKREFQQFDALDERLPAFQGKFSVAAADLNTGYADKGGWTFTLASDGVVDRIVSPIAGDGTPTIESATPAGQGVGDLVVLRGYDLDTVTAVTIDGAAVEKLIPIDNGIAVLIPTGVAGAAAIIATNEVGASEPFNYTAA
jgi:hypothetical protein